MISNMIFRNFYQTYEYQCIRDSQMLLTCSGALLTNIAGSFCKISRNTGISVDRNLGYSAVWNTST